jgi:hypothetical protein
MSRVKNGWSTIGAAVDAETEAGQTNGRGGPTVQQPTSATNLSTNEVVLLWSTSSCGIRCKLWSQGSRVGATTEAVLDAQ